MAPGRRARARLTLLQAALGTIPLPPFALGTQVDFSAYEREGHGQDAIFDSTALQQELGYVPRVDVRTAYNTRDQGA